MFNAGIPVLEALKITEKIANNRVIEKTLQQCRVEISEGKSIVNAFSTTDIFPPLVLRMIRVGESTGDLGNISRASTIFSEGYHRIDRQAADPDRTGYDRGAGAYFGMGDDLGAGSHL